MVEKADKPLQRTARLGLRVYEHEKAGLSMVAARKRRKPGDIVRALLRNYLLAEAPEIYECPRPAEADDAGDTGPSSRTEAGEGQQERPATEESGRLRLRSM